jgi:DNA-binding transcriptional MocR family regulator
MMRLSSPWQPRLSAEPGLVFERLSAALADDILDGKLAAGARLPAHRDLAYRLDIAIGTVTKAYGLLERRGLVHSVNGRGTFVAGAIARPRTLIDLSLNVPPVALGDRLLAATLVAMSKQLSALSFGTYMPAVGTVEHRAALAHWLSRGGPRISGDRLLLCNGAQHALALSFAIVCEPGATILTEAVTYPGAIGLAAHAGYRLVGLALDDQGVCPKALHAALSRGQSKSGRQVLYVTPTLQNPTARTMSISRRKEIVALCRRFNAVIVEDDVYGCLAQERQTSLLSLAPERTLFVSGLSKALTPGLRIGALVVPPDLYERATAALQASCTMASPLSCLMMHHWLIDGTAEAVARAVSLDASTRSRLACQVLEIPQPTANGYHLWMPFPFTKALAVQQAAASDGVLLTEPAITMVDDIATDSGVRICLGGPTIEALTEGLGRVRAILQENGSDTRGRTSVV